MGNLSRGQKGVAAGAYRLDGLSGARSGSLLGGLMSRLEPIPQSSLRAAPKRVQDAVQVVQDYADSLALPQGREGGKPAK